MLSVLDLFSGIGGFSLGLERTGGFRTVAFCEIEPFQRAVLAKHWPGVQCYDDVCTLTARRLAADGFAQFDVICGGFPCQDISIAGRGAGLDGARSGLWFQYARIIEETRPRWVVIENVAAIRTRGLDTVLSGISALGYDAEWHVISAGSIGAPHLRERVWILAHSARRGWRKHGHERGPHSDTNPGQPADCRQNVAHASGAGLPRPECAEWREPVITSADIRRTASERRWGRAAPGLDGETNGVSRWVDGTRPVEPWEGNTPRVVGKGYPNRRPRLKAIGNSVVPQITEMLGRAILRREAETADRNAA